MQQEGQNSQSYSKPVTILVEPVSFLCVMVVDSVVEGSVDVVANVVLTKKFQKEIIKA